MALTNFKRTVQHNEKNEVQHPWALQHPSESLDCPFILLLQLFFAQNLGNCHDRLFHMSSITALRRVIDVNVLDYGT